MSAVKLMGETIRATADLTADAHGFGCAKLVVFANAVSDNPLHGGRIPRRAGGRHHYLRRRLRPRRGTPRPAEGPRRILRHLRRRNQEGSLQDTRVGQLVGTLASERLGVPFNIIDLSLAPTAEIGDSVAHILEEMGLETVGTHGTVAALALLNDAVKKGGLMACSNVGGLSGSFIPISEDIGMIESAAAGHISSISLKR